VRGNEDNLFGDQQRFAEESVLAPVFETLIFLAFLALILCTDI
jgi:hypothetical protein